MLNHFPTHLQEPQPWFHKPGMDPTYNLNHYPAAAAVDDFEVKEPMFEKPLTPSDVGKLNRLVIPKQHAERYFPLGAGDAAGMLLGFEDESGKSWRFRYSYWNSSQSYVLTKGWSRYVKDKRLDAGDVVFFERHRADRQKLFIGWRRRGAASSSPAHYNAQGYRVAPHGGIPPNYQPDFPPRHPVRGLGGGPVEEEEKATRVQSASNNNTNQRQPTRLVRLFGVNFECELEDESSALASSSSRTTSSESQQAYHNYFNYMGYPAAVPSNYHHHPMDTEFEQQQQQQQMGNRLS